MFTFIELESFKKRRASLLSDDEFQALQHALIVNPELGDLIQGTGGFRKMRWAIHDRGKNAGVRIIYYNRSQLSGRLYLALIYAKNEAESLTSEQKQQLKRITNLLQ